MPLYARSLSSSGGGRGRILTGREEGGSWGVERTVDVEGERDKA